MNDTNDTTSKNDVHQTVRQFVDALTKHNAHFEGKGDGSVEVVEND